MGIKRVVNTDFWKDDIVAEIYSAEDRYFMLYLLTNPNTKQCGIYHLPIRTMAFELGYSQDATKSILNRFESKFKNIIYSKKTNEVAILNFLKHSIVKGGKPVEDCIRKELEQIKDKDLIVAVYKNIVSYMDEQIEYKEKSNSKSMYVGIKNVFKEFINDDEIDNENDNDNDNERIVPRIVNESPIDMSQENLFSYLESNFSRTISPTEIELLWSWLDEFNLEIIKYAVDISCFNNTKTVKYINGILNNWKSKGYKKLEECKNDSKGGNGSGNSSKQSDAKNGSKYSQFSGQ